MRELRIDVFQNVRLSLVDLPKLHTITPLAHGWENRIPRGGSIPTDVWLSKLDLQSVGLNKTLSFYASDLSEMHVSTSPQLVSLHASATRHQNPPTDFYGMRMGRVNPNRTLIAGDVGQQVMKVIVEGLSKSDGPPKVAIDGRLTDRADILKLKENQKLSDVVFKNGRVNPQTGQQIHGPN